MKKREQFEIIVHGSCGISTRFVRKTWRGVVSLIDKMEAECPNIWEDAFCISIFGVSSEADNIRRLVMTMED